MDRVRGVTRKAEEQAADHQAQIHRAVAKVEAAADKRTGGKYHDKIQKAGAKADELADRLRPEDEPTADADSGLPDADSGRPNAPAPPGGQGPPTPPS